MAREAPDRGGAPPRREEVELVPIAPGDSEAMERVIVAVMTEFGAVGCGFSIEDAEVRDMHAAYQGPDRVYFVARRAGRLVAGAGIAPLAGGEPGVCELRKMYALPEARGLGVGRRLLELCLDGARRRGYRLCYLETLTGMDGAQRLYEGFGFERIGGPLGATGHHGCDRWYALRLDARGS